MNFSLLALVACGIAPPPELSRLAAKGWRDSSPKSAQALNANWNAFQKCYPSRQDAVDALEKNSQVLLPAINSPANIAAANAALVALLGKQEAADIIRKNPGVLSCDASSLRTTPAADIRSAANFVAAVDSLPRDFREAIPVVFTFSLVAILGARAVQCADGACKRETAEWVGRGFGPRLIEFVQSLLQQAPGS